MLRAVLNSAAGGIVALALATACGPASATIIANLTDCGLSSGCGPAGTVYGTVDLSGSTITVTLSDGAFFASGNATVAKPQPYFAFNTTGSVDVSNISIANSVAVAGAPPNGSPPNGYGDWNNWLGVTANGSTPLATVLTFDIDPTTLFGPNTSGLTFAADIILNGNTGWVFDGGLNPVPLPPAALLFGTALAGLGFLGGRRKRRLA